MNGIRETWLRLTTPIAVCEDDARQEYILRAILILLGIVLFFFTIAVVVGWGLGAFLFEPVLTGLLMLGFISASWMLVRSGYRKAASLFPVALFFGLGLFGSYATPGFPTSLTLCYVIAILMTSILFGERAQWFVVLSVICGQLIAEWVTYTGTFEDFLPFTLTMSSSFIGISLLQGLATNQLHGALRYSRAYARELQNYREQLEQLVSERTAELVVVNANLRSEVADRERAQAELKRFADTLEEQVAARTAELTQANAGLQAEVERRRLAEAQIQASLREKEVLLKEVHHRVKNNLQVMVSLLSLQTAQVEDAQTLALFEESQDRIRSLALVHEELYRSGDLAQIDLAAYIEKLANGLIYAYQVAQDVHLRQEMDEVHLSLDTAVPCGLIVNELVSNALKHAFPVEKLPAGYSGEILISLRAGAENVELVVCDNGIGLPETLDMQNPSSLGLELVNVLIKQIRGSLVLSQGPGTRFHITFPHS